MENSMNQRIEDYYYLLALLDDEDILYSEEEILLYLDRYKDIKLIPTANITE